MKHGSAGMVSCTHVDTKIHTQIVLVPTLIFITELYVNVYDNKFTQSVLGLLIHRDFVKFNHKVIGLFYTIVMVVYALVCVCWMVVSPANRWMALAEKMNGIL